MFLLYVRTCGRSSCARVHGYCYCLDEGTYLTLSRNFPDWLVQYYQHYFKCLLASHVFNVCLVPLFTDFVLFVFYILMELRTKLMIFILLYLLLCHTSLLFVVFMFLLLSYSVACGGTGNYVLCQVNCPPWAQPVTEIQLTCLNLIAKQGPWAS